MKLNESESSYENVERTKWYPKQGKRSVALDKCRGNLITVCMEPGVKMARAYFRHSYGTWEAVVAMLSEKLNQEKLERVRVAKRSTVADCNRSSDEALVMRVERRVQPILKSILYQREVLG